MIGKLSTVGAYHQGLGKVDHYATRSQWHMKGGNLPGSSKETILLVSQNLFFIGKVEAQVQPLGYEVGWAKTQSAFSEFYESRQPALILVDLEGTESIWTDILEEIGRERATESKVIAFGPHEDVAMLERARNLGCDLVLNKGEFNRDLPKIIESMKVDAD